MKNKLRLPASRHLEAMRSNPGAKMMFAALAVVISLAAFLTILSAELPAIAKFVLAVLVLAACGAALAYAFRLELWGGMFLLRSQAGLKFLDSLAKKYPAAWQLFADIGMVVGFGLAAHFLMLKRKLSWKRVLLTYGSGFALLIVFTSIVAPLAMAVLFSLLSGGAEFAGAGSKLQAATQQFEPSKYIFLAIMVLGGMSLLTTASILIYAAMILIAIVSALLGNGAALAGTSPGGVPIIPGINLPLIEGVIALAIVLVVHEGMHGVLARLYKLPLKSAGLVFFGFLPFGAFVDIDEKKLFKEDKRKQNSVFVAGTAANFATSIIFLLLLFGFVAATADFRASGIYVDSGSLPAGTVITAINGQPIESFVGKNLTPNTEYTLQTNSGEIRKTTDEKGKLGIMYVVADRNGTAGSLRYSSGFEWMSFILRLLGLTFALNFIVAAINLVPLPLFDGYHIMKNGVNHKLAATLITYIVALAFLLNLFPWVLR